MKITQKVVVVVVPLKKKMFALLEQTGAYSLY